MKITTKLPVPQFLRKVECAVLNVDNDFNTLMHGKSGQLLAIDVTVTQ